MSTQARKNVAVMISGRGSNMAALIDAAAERDFPAEIVAVISDRADAPGLVLAGSRGIPTHVIGRGDFADKEGHERAIDALLGRLGAEIVCLAGYMRLLTHGFTDTWQGRLINIHPSLLPLFKGLHTHRRALEAGVRVHGCTAHFVTSGIDEGPIITQAAVPVLPSDTEESLARRVLAAEHGIYPLALKLLAEGHVRMEGAGVTFSQEAQTVWQPAASLVSPPNAPGPRNLEDFARFTP